MAVAASLYQPQNVRMGRATGSAVPFAWSGLQTLTLFSKTGHRQGPSLTQTYPRCEWSPALRRLANQSFDTFASVQEGFTREVNPVERMAFVQQNSRLYRAYMHEQVELLRKGQDGGSGAGLWESRQEEVSRNEERLLSSWELVWHLCEVLYLESLPPGCLVLQLLQWVKWHSTHADQLLRQVTNVWDGHQDYWTAVYALVFQGRMRDACKLLENHSERRNKKGRDSYDRMMSLLERCPVTKSIAGVTYQELVRIQSEWKLECKQRLQNGNFHESQHLTDLCNVLCSDEMAFNRVADSSDKIFPEWYHAFVGQLLFVDPLVEANDSLVSHLAEVYYSQPSSRARSGVDQMILLALQGDVIELIKLCSSSFSNWWFVAHLVDLLHHLGVMEATQVQHSSQQREFLLLEYASSLMSHPSLWQLAVEYFAHCTTQGRSMLGLLIERLPLTSERKAHKILHTCERFQLNEQAQSVCRVLGVRSLKSGHLGAALQWALKAKHSELVSYIAEQYMLDYERQGRLKDLVMLRNLQDDMLMSPQLLFLGKYCEFARLFGEEKYSQAGSLLVELLEAEAVPKRFWITVLTDALPLLDMPDKVTLSEEQTCTLMSCLEEICLSELDDFATSPEGLQAAKTQVGVIRLALVQNLARAILDS